MARMPGAGSQFALSAPFLYNAAIQSGKGKKSVSEEKKQRRRQAPARRRKGQQGSLSLAIPIMAGLVVLIMIVGAVLSIENRGSRTSAMPGNFSIARATLQAQSTSSIPNPNVPRISLQETQDKLEKGQAVLIDVRSKSSYDKAHAAAALSIPEEEIDARLDELPKDKDWIFYCT
jgi:Rhodanese-like domain